MKVLIKVGAYRRKDSGFGEIVAHPASNGPKYRPLRVWVAPDIAGETDPPKRASVGRDAKGHLILMSEKYADNRLFLIGEAPKPGHRMHGGINAQKTTAEVLERSSGYGAWGSGEVFAAILKPGQRVVCDLKREFFLVYSWDGEVLGETKVSETELDHETGLTEIEEI